MADPPVTDVAPKLARTYNPPGYTDPWDCVTDYHRVLDYAARHPDHGSSRAATRLELPRGRIRSWFDGATPDCVRAIQIAEHHDWIPLRSARYTFRGLNVLVAWIFSGGSISRQTYSPLFSVADQAAEARLTRALQAIGLDATLSRDETARHGREWRPTEHQAVLGRMLTVLGAPRGEKTADKQLSLPAYLETAPDLIRREFAGTYLANRGSTEPRRNAIRFREERSTPYLESVGGLLSEVTNERVSVHPPNLVLSVEATAVVEDWPPVLGD